MIWPTDLTSHGSSFKGWFGTPILIRETDITALQKSIKREFGKSPLDLYHELRPHSTFRTIAATMEISEKTLRRWRVDWGEPLCTQAYSDDRMLDEFSSSRPTDVKAKMLGYMDASHAVTCMTEEGLTNGKMAKMLGCCVMTILRYKPEELKREYERRTRAD
jgi:hypothetical protein